MLRSSLEVVVHILHVKWEVWEGFDCAFCIGKSQVAVFEMRMFSNNNNAYSLVLNCYG
jgi:hypothetical protein